MSFALPCNCLENFGTESSYVNCAPVQGDCGGSIFAEGSEGGWRVRGRRRRGRKGFSMTCITISMGLVLSYCHCPGLFRMDVILPVNLKLVVRYTNHSKENSLPEVLSAEKTWLESRDRISAFESICLVSCFKTGRCLEVLIDLIVNVSNFNFEAKSSPEFVQSWK